MDEAAQTSPPPVKSVLTKEERSQIAKDAAKRRWAKAKKEAAKSAKTKASSAKVLGKKKSAGPREFSSALKMAEKRLAKAIQERAEAAAKYAVLVAEIPSLQRIIMALRDPSAFIPQQYYTGTTIPVAPPTLEQIVGDQPLAYANPPRAAVPAIPVPQPLHPANNPQNRAQGGAIAVALDDEGNEDQFLRDSPVSGGEWH